MPFQRGTHVVADIGGWLAERGPIPWAEPLKYPGKVVKVAFRPDWTYSVLLDNAPVTIPGGEQISVVEGLREDQLTAEP